MAGRPSRNPVEKPRTQLYVHQVFLDARMTAKTAAEFGKAFESDKSKNDYQGDCRYNRKWESLIRGESSPNAATRKKITQLLGNDNAERLYSSILWEVLKVGDFPDSHWLKLLKSPELFYFNKGVARPVYVLHVGFEQFQKIGLQQTIEGFACLVALYRHEQSNKYPCELILAMLEDVLFRTLLALSSQEPFKSFFVYLWSFICNHIKKSTDFEANIYRSLSAEHASVLDIYIKSATSQASDIGLVTGQSEKFLFMFFAPKCDFYQLVEEMFHCTSLNSEVKISESGLGLYWLITEMNRHLLEGKKKKLANIFNK